MLKRFAVAAAALLAMSTPMLPAQATTYVGRTVAVCSGWGCHDQHTDYNYNGNIFTGFGANMDYRSTSYGVYQMTELIVYTPTGAWLAGSQCTGYCTWIPWVSTNGGDTSCEHEVYWWLATNSVGQTVDSGSQAIC